MNDQSAREAAAKLASRIAAGGTANQQAFADWLVEASEYTFKSKAEQDAFRAGAMLGTRAYHLFQAAKPTSTRYTAPERPKSRRKAALAPRAVAERGEKAMKPPARSRTAIRAAAASTTTPKRTRRGAA